MIDEKATKCKFCQADLRNWFMRHKIISTIIAIPVIIGFISAAIPDPQIPASSPDAMSFPVFNVEQILGKDINDTEKILGVQSPENKQRAESVAAIYRDTFKNNKMQSAIWFKEGIMLLANYEDLKVIDYICVSDPQDQYSHDQLLAKTNIKTSSSQYTTTDVDANVCICATSSSSPFCIK